MKLHCSQFNNDQYESLLIKITIKSFFLKFFLQKQIMFAFLINLVLLFLSLAICFIVKVLIHFSISLSENTLIFGSDRISSDGLEMMCAVIAFFSVF